ncbi:AfsR/SARP family transcriptional regulator [Flindersiella endophytica]
MRLRYRVLGSLEVTADNGELLSLQGDKQSALLAVLLCERSRTVPADQLAYALSRPGRAPMARRSIPVYVHRLRSVLGKDRLHNDAGNGYRLDVEPDELDADGFEQLAASGRAALLAGAADAASTSLKRALSMWRSHAYAGLEDIELVRVEADRLNEIRAESAEAWVEAELTLGRHQKVVPELTALVHANPLRQRLRAHLMLALYRSGRAADALRLYRETRALFVRELGAEPSAELRALQQSILRDDLGPASAPNLAGRANPNPARPAGRARTAPEPAAAVPAELPTTNANFTGRQDELARLLNARTRLLALNGPGGVGKSTLALQAAAALAARHPDGQLYVNLRGATPGAEPVRPQEALRRMLRSLGVSDQAIPADAAAAAAYFRSLTAARRLLLVLDDAVDEAQVRPLLPAGPEATTLITSRPVLDRLEGAEHIAVGGLDAAEAVALLGRLVGEQRVAAEPGSAAEIVRSCGWLPLAVRIAGARLTSRPDWTLGTLAGRLRDERDRLDVLQHADLAVRTSMAVGRQDIRESAEQLLGLVGVLGLDDVSLPAIAALDGRSTALVRRDLDRLVAAQLVERLPASSGDRFALHDLVRLHAREQAAAHVPEAEQNKAIRRLVHFYVATMRDATRRYAPLSPWRVRAGLADEELLAHGLELDDREAIVAWIRAESGNLVPVAQRAARLTGSAELLTAYSVAMHVPVQSQGYWQERRDVYELTVETGAAAGLPYVQRDLGLVYRNLEQLDLAEAVLEQAIHAFGERGEAFLEGDTLVLLADVGKARGDHRVALERLGRARASSHTHGDYRVEAHVLVAIGELMAAEGDYARAREHYDQALKVYRAHNSTVGTGRALGLLGELCRRFGHPAEAVAFLEEAVAAHRKVGWSLREAGARWDLADALYELGQVEAARTHWQAALDLGVRIAVISPETAAVLRAEPRPAKPATLGSDA